MNEKRNSESRGEQGACPAPSVEPAGVQSDEASLTSARPREARKRWKVLVSVLVIGAAGLMLANAMTRKSGSAANTGQERLAGLQAQGDRAEVARPAGDATQTTTKDKSAPFCCGAMLSAFASLGQVAGDRDAVFILLAGEDSRSAEAVGKTVEGAAKKIESHGYRIAPFTLERNAADYARVAKQIPVPCVVAIGKSGGAVAVSGEVTEQKLLEAFVMAIRPPSACGAGGCGPSGCN